MGYIKNGEVLPCVADYDQLCFGSKLDPSANVDANQKLTENKYNDPGMRGFYTEVAYTATIGLATLTAGTNAISHAQETHNPFPERITSYAENSSHGYLFFLPRYVSGVLQREKVEIRILKNEDEIIALYNEFMRLGYQMPVNMKWGWQLVDGKYHKYKNRVIYKDLMQITTEVESEDEEKAVQYMSDLYEDILKVNLLGDLEALAEKEELLAAAEYDYSNRFLKKSPYEEARGFLMSPSEEEEYYSLYPGSWSAVVRGIKGLFGFVPRPDSIEVEI
ncbi:MAG: hypothetical protein GY817_02245 [bacterium]|nr:hypothetical protein [bacterium]